MTGPAPRYQRFFAELKRRRVFKAAAIYGATSFAVLQVADIVLPSLGLPEWTITFTVAFIVLLFPAVLILAWAFDVTPEGIRKTDPASEGEIEAIVAQPASKRWPSGLLALTGVVIVVAAILSLGLVSEGDDLDPNRIVVFPLVVSESYAGSGSAGEDIATMIGSALDGTGPLRWADGWSYLTPDQRRDIRGLTKDEAQKIARECNCGFFITGRILPKGDSADIALVLTHTRGDSEHRGQATAPADQVWRGVSAVNQLLPVLIPGGVTEVASEWEDRPPVAVASYMLGEAAFRRLHVDEALRHFRAAVAADSTFAYAAIRGAQAASWSHRTAEAVELAQTASLYPLPPRYAAYVRGLEAYLEGRADSAIESFRSVIALDDNMAAAWLQLGETWTHLLPTAGSPDDSALVAFQEAARLEANAGTALFHLVEILIRRGEIDRAEPLLAQLLEADPEGSIGDHITIMLECVRNGAEAMPWAQLVAEKPFQLLIAARHLGGAGAQVACAQAAYSALLLGDTSSVSEAENRRFFELLGAQNLLLAQGRVEDALAQVETFYARWGYGSSLFLLSAPLYEAYAGKAREMADADARQYGASYRGRPSNLRLWELGVFEASTGNAPSAAEIAAELARRASESGDRHTLVLATSAAAHAAQASGDSGAAFLLFESMVPAVATGDLLSWDEAEPLGSERLEYARGLVARGDHRRAIEVADVFDSSWPSVYTLYLKPSLQLRAEAAAALGDSRLELHYRDRLRRLQERVEPPQ